MRFVPVEILILDDEKKDIAEILDDKEYAEYYSQGLIDLDEVCLVYPGYKKGELNVELKNGNTTTIKWPTLTSFKNLLTGGKQCD